ALVKRMMEKVPADRAESAAALREEIAVLRERWPDRELFVLPLRHMLKAGDADQHAMTVVRPVPQALLRGQTPRAPSPALPAGPPLRAPAPESMVPLSPAIVVSPLLEQPPVRRRTPSQPGLLALFEDTTTASRPGALDATLAAPHDAPLPRSTVPFAMN